MLRRCAHLVLLAPAVLGCAPEGFVDPEGGRSTHVVRPDGSGDFATIYEAVLYATEGDTLVLTAGEFRGEGNADVDLGTKHLMIMADPPGEAIIQLDDAGVPSQRAFRIAGGQHKNLIFRGLVIEGGHLAGDDDRDDQGGGAVRIIGSAPTFQRCTFRHNQAREGGAVAVTGGSPVFEDCIFDGNTALASASSWHDVVGGGAILQDGGGLVLRDCLFTANRCTLATDVSDLEAIGGAVAATGDLRGRISGCTFEDNLASHHGGALAIVGSAPDLVGLLLADNQAGGLGGGLYVAGESELTAEAITVVRNTATAGGGLALVGGPEGRTTGSVARAIVADNTGGGVLLESADLLFSCSDIHGHDDDWPGDLADQLGVDGNINADPLFCSDGARLQAGSPCDASCGVMGARPVGCESPSSDQRTRSCTFLSLPAMVPRPTPQ